METHLNPGKYVLAVSGGVDSIVLFDVLKRQPHLELIIAHYDHGIRPDSYKDKQLVEDLAARYELPFIHEKGHLGPHASEAEARAARYAFLHSVRLQHQVRALITAHHQDDLLETAILNLIRGTGRRGLTALSSTPTIHRPFLNIPKQQIIEYAQRRNLKWREDSTNHDDKYLRNYIRLHILPRANPATRQQFLDIITQLQHINHEADIILTQLLQAQATPRSIDRRWFANLPHQLAKEFLASWLRQSGLADFSAKTLERLTIAAKTKAPGAKIDIMKGVTLDIRPDQLALTIRER